VPADPTSDHHSAYLARAVEALSPEGRRRVDELLDQLAGAAGGRERLLRFAGARRAEADAGDLAADPAGNPEPALAPDEIRALTVGFRTIRDEESRDDVADWANAVLALLDDEAARGHMR
jgi:hypothetical protein